MSFIRSYACISFRSSTDHSVSEMVVFFCTFLAMKAEDRESSNRQIEDHELRGEISFYSG